MRSAGVLRLAMAVTFAVSLGHAEDPVVKFEVPQAFRVGSHEYASGTISVRPLRDYNPTTALLEVRVNDQCIGMMSARRDASTDRASRTEALFTRDDEGRLVMTGFRSTGTTFRFQEPAVAQASAPTAALIGSN
ncbi:MAG TPA: hypothetical protein VFV19_06680 [Candidatus Polarisedimenticolaceae bacterium]|nr:hypothetical protein [Candidatus Polarisedimenticolaceae bacterium]